MDREQLIAEYQRSERRTFGLFVLMAASGLGILASVLLAPL